MTIDILAAAGFGSFISTAIAWLLILKFLPSYLSEKGRNLATKEDIADITHEVEKVRAEYAAILEELKAKHSLRLAAIDKRLEVHQTAFIHWRELMSSIHTDNVATVALSCQSWWNENCLYLEPDVRSAFAECHRAAFQHASLLRNPLANDEVNKNWDVITSFPSILFKAITLPTLTESEKFIIKPAQRESA